MQARSHGLRGEEGYYCDIVEVGEYKYYIQELPDDGALQEYFALTSKIVEAEKARRSAPSTEATTEVLKLYKERNDLVVTRGVTKWEGYGETECVAANLLKLPSPNKAAIFRAVEKHSLLNYEEEDFSEPPPVQ